MFAHLDLTGLPQSKLFNYAKDVPYFQGRSQVTFQPGLNILVGPNGCGKSTVLNILGRPCARPRAACPRSRRRRSMTAWT